ncbi:MAG: tRNA (N6-threonylcarbamoyladenosine(37)-N6)-methyltransferase TrmO [Cyanobacteria bacterium J06648_16]
MMGHSFSFSPIARIRSCYPERFGIPRQAGLVPSAYAEVVFERTEANRLALRGIEQFSHLWILFVFHRQHYPKKFKPLVQPPRLGGRKTMGVYATRSPNRQNPIGMSAVLLDGLAETAEEIVLQVRGGDFLDGTPVIDVKPYVGYADAIATAHSPWQAEPLLPVVWSEPAQAVLAQTPAAPRLRQVIEETLAQDPRPAHERGRDGQPGQEWNMQLGCFSVFWAVDARRVRVTRLVLRAEEPESELA